MGGPREQVLKNGDADEHEQVRLGAIVNLGYSLSARRAGGPQP
jgi:hypothetical protein